MKIAIDPGASGGIAFEGPTGMIGTWSMPDTTKGVIALLLAAGAPATVYLESLIKYTGFKMPGSAMAVYAANWGRVDGIAQALGMEVIYVHPKKWQNVLGLKRPKKMPKPEWKNLLKAEAEKIFPTLKVTLKTADALLILAAAQRGSLDEASK